MASITIEVQQKLKEKFLQHMTYRLVLKDLAPDINPADAVLILVATALAKDENKA